MDRWNKKRFRNTRSDELRKYNRGRKLLKNSDWSKLLQNCRAKEKES